MNFFSKLKPANPGSSADLRAALDAAEAEMTAIAQRRDEAQAAVTEALFSGDAKAAEKAAQAEEQAALDLSRLQRLTTRYQEAITVAEQAENAAALETRAKALAARSREAADDWQRQAAALRSFRSFLAAWAALSGERAGLLAELTSSNTPISGKDRERLLALLGEVRGGADIDLAARLLGPQLQALQDNWQVAK